MFLQGDKEAQILTTGIVAFFIPTKYGRLLLLVVFSTDRSASIITEVTVKWDYSIKWIGSQKEMVHD